MTYKEAKEALYKLYPVNSVLSGYLYWRQTLSNKCIGIFDYENMPENLLADEVENMLIQFGYCGVFEHSKFGVVAAYGGKSGYDIYYRPTNFVYAQPILGGGNLKVGKNCVIMYNSFEDKNSYLGGLSKTIRRYSRMLADIDSSINIMTVNSRATNTPTAKDSATAESINSTYEKIRLGEFSVINENGILDTSGILSLGQAQDNRITELIEVRENLIKSFLKEIGVKSSYNKRERMITDEVTTENQLLIINLKNMLESRRTAVASINKLFGCNIKVKISDEYNPNTENMMEV